MRKARNAEEFEIGYTAFVMAARTITFVLQKEFSGNEHFQVWYRRKKEELDNNQLAKFYIRQRNSIEKEGINALEFFIKINELQLPADIVSQPENSSIKILPEGIFYSLNEGTSKEDLIPAHVKGKITIGIFFRIEGQVWSVLVASEAHYLTLKEVVDEWTGIMNESDKVAFRI